MDTDIRRLNPTEFSKLVEMNEAFAKVFDDSDTYQSNPPSKVYAKNWLSNSDNIAVIAEKDRKITGGLIAYTLHKFEQDRSEVYIYDLGVILEYQRRGIGRDLVKKVCEIAKEQGSYVVFVQADEGDDAIKFYESLNPIENLRTRSFDLRID